VWLTASKQLDACKLAGQYEIQGWYSDPSEINIRFVLTVASAEDLAVNDQEPELSGNGIVNETQNRSSVHQRSYSTKRRESGSLLQRKKFRYLHFDGWTKLE